LLGNIHGTRILLLSQLGRTGQVALLEHNPNLHADIVIAGLPEQTEPLNNTLLESIRPSLIIISDSKAPATRHASHTLRNRLEKSGTAVIYTSDVGAVKISLSNNIWNVKFVDGTKVLSSSVSAFGVK
jgi:beta-lactamase superfamily II metal-dependent hydrolase